MTETRKRFERAMRRCQEDLALWQTLTHRLRESREELAEARRAVQAEEAREAVTA